MMWEAIPAGGNMALSDIVIASLSQAQESMGFTRKSLEYLERHYAVRAPNVSESIYPNKFSGDEFTPEIKCDLNGKNAYLFAVPTNPANSIHYVKPDAMMGRVILAASAAKEHGARTVTVVAPDLFFSRADKGLRDLQPGAPEEKKSLFAGKGKSAEAQAIAWKAAGVDRVITLHLHSSRVAESYEKVYSSREALIGLSPTPLVVHYIINHSMIDLSNRGENLVLIRADLGADNFTGGLYRCLHSLGYTNVSRIDFEKVRKKQNDPNNVEAVNPTFSRNYTGLEGKTGLLGDDIDDTGGTKGAICRHILGDGISNGKGNHKPRNLVLYATHPVLSGIQFEAAMRKLVAAEPLELVYMNTHPFIEDNMIYEMRKRTSIIRTAWFFGEAIRCMEEGIGMEDAYTTGGILDLERVGKFVPEPFRRTERKEYQAERNHSR